MSPKAGDKLVDTLARPGRNMTGITNMALETREMAEAGALITYGPSNVALFRRRAHFVDKILKGAKPADLPVEQPPVLELCANEKTAKALGVAIAPSISLRANEVFS